MPNLEMMEMMKSVKYVERMKIVVAITVVIIIMAIMVVVMDVRGTRNCLRSYVRYRVPNAVVMLQLFYELTYIRYSCIRVRVKVRVRVIKCTRHVEC